MALLASSFDLIAAVGYSIWVLAYCYTNFDFDRRAFQLNLDVLPPGGFENMARMAAGSQETTLFRTCFDSLGFQTLGILFVRVDMNLTLCHRFHVVVNALLHEHGPAQRVAAVHPSSSGLPDKRVRPQRRVPRLFAAVFVAFGAVVIVCVEKAMAASHAACVVHPQCVAYAYRW